MRLVGYIPAPIVFGKLLDIGCAVWNTHCDIVGACQVYNSTDLAMHMALIIASVKVSVRFD